MAHIIPETPYTEKEVDQLCLASKDRKGFKRYLGEIVTGLPSFFETPAGPGLLRNLSLVDRTQLDELAVNRRIHFEGLQGTPLTRLSAEDRTHFERLQLARDDPEKRLKEGLKIYLDLLQVHPRNA